jgi:hypothetical protein
MAVVQYKDGLYPGNPREAEEQTLGSCRFFVPNSDDVPSVMLLGQVDPVIVSEVLKDLTALASKGT